MSTPVLPVADPVTGVGPDKGPATPKGFTDPVTGEVDVFGAAGSPLETRLYIVTMAEDQRPLSERAREVLGQVAPEVLLGNLGMFTVQLTEAQAAALARRPGVAGVEEDQVVSLTIPVDSDVEAAKGKPGGGGGGGGTTTPSTEMLDWGVKRVWGDVDRSSGAFPAYSNRVFVLDGGISAKTNDLNFNESLSRDFTGSRTGFYDKYGHGTHVAGTIAAYANNNRGGVGVAPGAEVVSFKVLNDRGSGSVSGIVTAINAMIDAANIGDVANMSLGGNFSSALNEAIFKAASSDKKLRFAIAAGNEYRDVDSTSPASAGNPGLGIYVISAHDIDLKNSKFTNFDNYSGSDADNVAFAAPGVDIYSLGLDGSMVPKSGTSMASPHAAGILLLGGFKAGTEFAIAYGSEQADPLAVSSYWG